ncbi:MAG: dephospho-CoA kinase [Candidatus Nomurabacteria bacterium]|jgi:dephospho-CoA kinase|nr:dephospho-CoA kinase [Candidatus Nomurabacteria bacterium]
MKKVALTGNIAAGKSAAQARLEDLGFLVFDTDRAGHEALLAESVKKAFDDVLDADGEISRRKLGRLVFGDRKLLKKLERISHPVIVRKMREFFDDNRNAELVFAAVPLLFEVGLETEFDKVIFIQAAASRRQQRLMRRDNLSEQQARLRIAAQDPPRTKIRRSDFVIVNNGSLLNLYKQLDDIIAKLC